MNTIWTQFLNYISQASGKQLGYVENTILDNIKKSLFANLIFNNLKKFKFNQSNITLNMLTKPEHMEVIFSNQGKASIMRTTQGMKIVTVNKGNIVNHQGMPKDEKTVYIIDHMYNNVTLYMPHKRVIVTTLAIQQFLTSDEVILTHLINQTTDILEITEKTLRYVETHETTKLLSKNILESKLMVQAQGYIREERAKKLKEIEEAKVQITKYEETIKKTTKDIAEIEHNLIFMKGGEQMANELYEMADKMDQISYLLVDTPPNNSKTTIKVKTFPIEMRKYDRDRLDRMLGNGSWSHIPKFKKAIQEVANGDAVLTFSAYEINIDLHLNGTLTYSLLANTPSRRNPHENIGCYGGYNSHVQKFQKDKLMIPLILILLEFLGSITFGDGGSSDLPDKCQIHDKKGKLIYG